MSETYELRTSRTFDAPREALYRAWTEPESFAAWFGPEGISVPLDTVRIDVRPGGEFACVMVDGEGNEYPQSGTYLEVEDGRRIVTTEPDSGLRMTLTFSDAPGGGSELAVHQENLPAQYAGPEAEAGWASTLDCLERFLAGR